MPSIAPREREGIGSRDEMNTVLVAAALITGQNGILLTQREEGDDQGLLWEFPGGKVEEGEEPRQTLQRELREELGIEADAGEIFDVTYHPYPEYPVLLLVYRCRIKGGLPRPLGCRDLRWVSLRELKDLPMPPADKPIRDHLFSDQEGAFIPRAV
jgi:8-oxo-dGTP diphosphatase